MTTDRDNGTYVNPLTARYASRGMARIFSPDVKFSTWRRLWIALAEAEQALGLPITDEQLDDLRRFETDINYAEAEAQEKKVRHDVMAHVHAYGLQAVKAAPIIHLGATSAYVGDNTDIIQMRDALRLLADKLLRLMAQLAGFAMEYRALPTLGFTHFQPAQLVTVGKRAALWLQDFYYDYQDVAALAEGLPLLGVKGTTGTQASFLALFEGDHGKVRRLEGMVCEKLGFSQVVAVSGQTYTRKFDSKVLSVLSGIAQSASKMSNDLRLLQHLKEVEEPFEKGQIGSSAMAYKRNPMRSERVGSLARYILGVSTVPPMTESTQWFERTLDDSANRRIVIPEAFMAADAILDILRNVTDPENGLVVHPEVIRQHILAELPFMATENILMDAVKKGGDRQVLHEVIRVHSQAAAARVKDEGLPNDLLERLATDPAVPLSSEEIDALLEPSLYTGRSAEQTEEFVREVVLPLTEGIEGTEKVELNV
ncbi:MAG: adenylosuccinate lyase [Clostridiales Family XIII bacterium]|jgi:adenylosuccinate lyase|nr:adenylosuccinate lyase [Clostridiales Family XIII bacterium]